MTLFFDRNVGTAIPQALIHLKIPVQVEYHAKRFPPDAPDDQWLADAGAQDWTVVGQDYKFHVLPSELQAIKSYRVGCIYLWGAQASKWDTARVFIKGFDRIVDAIRSTPRPFVFRVTKTGRLIRVRIP